MAVIIDVDFKTSQWEVRGYIVKLTELEHFVASLFMSNTKHQLQAAKYLIRLMTGIMGEEPGIQCCHETVDKLLKINLPKHILGEQ